MSFLKIKEIHTMCMLTALLSMLIVVMDCTPINSTQNDTETKPNNLTSTICDRPICQNWELVTNLTIEDTLPVYKFKSKRTGMTIALATAESPIVNGYFCLSTEAFNNDGLPHTLEHLVFLGR